MFTIYIASSYANLPFSLLYIRIDIPTKFYLSINKLIQYKDIFLKKRFYLNIFCINSFLNGLLEIHFGLDLSRFCSENNLFIS